MAGGVGGEGGCLVFARREQNEEDGIRNDMLWYCLQRRVSSTVRVVFDFQYNSCHWRN